MSTFPLRAASLRIERETGRDSIRTIERVYSRTDSGAYECVYPDCRFVRHSAAAMWLHISGPCHKPRKDFDHFAKQRSDPSRAYADRVYEAGMAAIEQRRDSYPGASEDAVAKELGVEL